MPLAKAACGCKCECMARSQQKLLGRTQPSEAQVAHGCHVNEQSTLATIAHMNGVHAHLA